MPRNGKLKLIERNHNESVETLIPRLLEALGTPYRVAAFLGVYPFTIRYWLINNGYQFVDGRWCLVGEENGHKEKANI